MLSMTDTALSVLPLPRASIRYQVCKSGLPSTMAGVVLTSSIIHTGKLMLSLEIVAIRSPVIGSIPASWPLFNHQEKLSDSG